MDEDAVQDNMEYHNSVEEYLKWQIDHEGAYSYSPEWKSKQPISCLK